MDDKPIYITIAVPISHSCLINLEVERFCDEAQRKWGDNLLVCQVPSYTAECGRNVIVEALLQGPLNTHVFFLDADTVPPDDAIDRLLAHDKDIVAGVTLVQSGTKKRDHINVNKSPDLICKWNVAIDDPDRLIDYEDLPDHLFKATRIGGTTILVKRKVFETIGWPYFKTIYNRMGVEEGEDWYFARKVREAGFEIWIDPSIKCKHYNYVDLLEVYEAARQALQKKTG